MGLLDGFEKLINEHGSASILKERIDLANDKYAALEQKLMDSELRVKQLVSDNQALNLSLQEAQIEIQSLKKLSEKPQSGRLDDVREKILIFVASNAESTSAQIAQVIGVSENVTDFHLEELRKLKMVSNSNTMGSSWTGERGRTDWTIAHEGNGYLISNGLVA